mgnify:CR=1 FL=1
MKETALIVGAGSGLSASLARLCASENMNVALAARNIDKLDNLKNEINAHIFKCDSSNIQNVSSIFEQLDKTIGSPNLVIYNPSLRIRGNIQDLNPEATQEAINVTCFGGFLVAQQAAKRMIKNKKGSIFFTGASASKKGFAKSSVFAMGKFGLRGLAQSLARELHPQNIHIGHFVIDGGIGKNSLEHKLINPDSIAKTYIQFHKQDPSAWSWEVELRTNKEIF